MSVIWTNKESYGHGEPIPVHYRVKNVSDGAELLWHLGFWQNHLVIVKDESGKEVSFTRGGQAKRNLFAPGKSPGSIQPTPLEPGTTFDAPEQNLSNLVVLSAPGSYSVQFVFEEKQDLGWKGRLESNVVTIKIAK